MNADKEIWDEGVKAIDSLRGAKTLAEAAYILGYFNGYVGHLSKYHIHDVTKRLTMQQSVNRVYGDAARRVGV